MATLTQRGGCLCGAVRYEVRGEPARVTICHCRFCQRATGSAYMVEPIFRRENFSITSGTPSTFDLQSAGSGKMLRIHFCDGCGTKLYLSFDRFPESYGVYAGTFDEPDWFDFGPDNSRHIFIDMARHDTILPPGVKTYGQHALHNDGSDAEPVVFDQPRPIGRSG